jgi:cell shape-determining protein MreC
MFDRTELSRQLSRPTGALVIALALAAIVTLLPHRWTAAAKSAVAEALRPGQVAVGSARQECERLWTGARRHWNTVDQLANAQQELERLRDENRRLQAELTAASAREDRTDKAADQRLLSAEGVEANVLGLQARAFLGRHHLLDLGSQAGIEPEAMVVDAGPGLIDRGTDAQLEVGHLVLSGNSVWGKVVEVGRSTSTVRTATEAGFRDLVRLGNADNRQSDRHSGPQGIWEGTGEPLARVRLVEATEPVAVGDAVYAAAGQGLLSEPLVYGHVVRAEHLAGASHWEIWVKPAVERDEPDRVAVLRTKVNATRVADTVQRREQ